MGQLRVLVVEEEAAARQPATVREPFFLAGNGAGGLLDACLRALVLPLIDRRRLASDSIAYQVVMPDARVDVASPARTAEELVAWGLAKPEVARGLVRGLTEAAAGEREALLDAPVVRASRSAARTRSCRVAARAAPRARPAGRSEPAARLAGAVARSAGARARERRDADRAARSACAPARRRARRRRRFRVGRGDPDRAAAPPLPCPARRDPPAARALRVGVGGRDGRRCAGDERRSVVRPRAGPERTARPARGMARGFGRRTRLPADPAGRCANVAGRR